MHNVQDHTVQHKRHGARTPEPEHVCQATTHCKQPEQKPKQVDSRHECRYDPYARHGSDRFDEQIREPARCQSAHIDVSLWQAL